MLLPNPALFINNTGLGKSMHFMINGKIQLYGKQHGVPLYIDSTQI